MVFFIIFCSTTYNIQVDNILGTHTVTGGSMNKIQCLRFSSTITGGSYNSITNRCGYSTIVGGTGNFFFLLAWLLLMLLLLFFTNRETHSGFVFLIPIFCIITRVQTVGLKPAYGITSSSKNSIIIMLTFPMLPCSGIVPFVACWTRAVVASCPTRCNAVRVSLQIKKDVFNFLVCFVIFSWCNKGNKKRFWSTSFFVITQNDRMDLPISFFQSIPFSVPWVISLPSTKYTKQYTFVRLS